MKRVLNRLVQALGLLLLLLVGVILFRTLTFTSMQLPAGEHPLPEVRLDRAVDTLSAALRFETIAYRDASRMDAEPFRELHALLEERFPLVHERLRKEMVSDLSLMYHWEGRDPSRKAIILLAHQDVVPAPDAADWEYPPFSGAVADGYVWGRGTMDVKGSMIAQLEAVETLLEGGFQPDRDIYLCYGHDEEVGGWNGAAVMAALLRDRGVEAEFSLDEGMSVVGGEVLGLDRPIAFVCLTEKGYLSLELTAAGEPGHSSTPPRETTIGILATAVARIAATPMKPKLSEPIRLMFRYLGPEMAFPMRAVLANLWLTEPLVLRSLAQARATDAAIRTTTAVTIIEGGHTENVLPATARAVVNYRLLPGDTVAAMTERTRNLVNDERITVAPTRPPNESPPPSQVDVPGFRALHETIAHIFPDALVAPAMLLGGSDSHHYAIVAENTYGFLPIRMAEDDLERIHGPNERILMEDFEGMIAFYMLLIESTTG